MKFLQFSSAENCKVFATSGERVGRNDRSFVQYCNARERFAPEEGTRAYAHHAFGQYNASERTAIGKHFIANICNTTRYRYGLQRGTGKNVLSSKYVTVLDIIMRINDSHHANALVPIDVTLFGIVTAARKLQSVNASFPILSTLPGIVTPVSHRLS